MRPTKIRLQRGLPGGAPRLGARALRLRDEPLRIDLRRLAHGHRRSAPGAQLLARGWLRRHFFNPQASSET